MQAMCMQALMTTVYSLTVLHTVVLFVVSMALEHTKYPIANV